MATIHTVINPIPRLTSFTGGTDAQRLAQGAARGEVRYQSAIASSWPATGVGDNRSLSFSMELDPDYAWVMTDCSCSFIALSTNVMKMEAIGFIEVKIPTKGIDQYIYTQMVSEPSRQDILGNSPIGSISAHSYNNQYPIIDVAAPSAMVFQSYSDSLPTYMLYPFDNTNDTVDVNVVFSEGATQEIAMTPRFSARFLQYDIDQAYDWRVQSPTLTR